ncbi:uncharacterized protein LOC130729383 isoform X2 [Lotus japonicus]|uniref:uncharacterized protein LOC130729383 isoform X2 n=1 Tax=Lotus japonicus TaxID=34305 RepID=UPI0025834CB3|nr:uncharacterized protein LOC130729383 isoform X2 [Lotus japonicus]
MAATLPSSPGGGLCCIFGPGIHVLWVLCSFCWEEGVSVYCYGPLDTPADPADSGVLKSIKCLKIPDSKKLDGLKDSKLGEESTSPMHDGIMIIGAGVATNLFVMLLVCIFLSSWSLQLVFFSGDPFDRQLGLIRKRVFISNIFLRLLVVH